MGFFDPAHKKMLTKAPAAFQASAQLWGIFIEVVITNHEPLNPNIFRAYVVGLIALRSAKEEPGIWSRDATNYITAMTNNAFRAMSAQDRQIADATFAAIVTGDYLSDSN